MKTFFFVMKQSFFFYFKIYIINLIYSVKGLLHICSEMTELSKVGKQEDGGKKRKKIFHNHFFTKYMWSGIDCSCCQLKCSLATIMAQWKYKMAHHVLSSTPITDTHLMYLQKNSMNTKSTHLSCWKSAEVFICC